MATASEKPVVRERPTWADGEPKVLVIPAKAHTYNGFIDWVMTDALPEKARVTFLDGEVTIDMTEESLQTHIAVKGAITSVVYQLVTGEDLGEYYIDGTLICNKRAKVSNNPDGAAALWKTIEAGGVRFVRRKGRERAVQGSPDWVLEILSDHSVKKDTKQMRSAYHKAEIAEYWLVDALGDDLVFHVLHWRKNGYIAAPDQDGWLESKVFARYFRLTRKQNRRGAWTYTLEFRTEKP
jgi:Uma2 family endonuclease